jgi:C4-dicarboxylate-specific signal transduction histidine kinase
MKIKRSPDVYADAVQLEQVLLNLCINARDALNGMGTVNVAVRPVAASISFARVAGEAHCRRLR